MFVLIPGAGGDPWYWHRVVPELEARVHDAVAVRLPAGDDAAGWAEYADAIVEAIDDGTGVVLVAQSLAGFSAPIACERAPVELLVLLNAMIPKPGETGNDWSANTGSHAAQADYLATIGLTPEQAEDERVLYFRDVPPEVVEEAYRQAEPAQSMTPMGQPWPLTAWPKVDTRVVTGPDDRLFPAAFQRRVTQDRLGIEPDELDGGLPPRAQPAPRARRPARDVLARGSRPLAEAAQAGPRPVPQTPLGIGCALGGANAPAGITTPARVASASICPP